MNATIQFTCPQCSHTMQLPAAVEGKQGKCPSCNAVVTITNNGMVDLASLQQQPIPQQPEPSPTHPVQQQSDVQQPVATEDVPLEMGNMRFAEKNLAPGEYIIHAGRTHPRLKKFLVGTLVVFTLFQIGILAFYPERTVQDLLPGVLLIGFFSSGLGLTLRYIYVSHSNIELVLTNKRLLSKRGIFFIKTRDVQLESVGSIDFRLGFFERYWFNCGQITVRNTGGVKVGFFPFLADALEFRRRILAQIDRMQT